MPQAATVPRTVLLAFLIVTAAAAPARATDWTVKQCVLESGRQPMPDGYQETTVHFVVTPKSVALVSEAPLDGSGPDLGVQVDDEPFVRIDKLDGDRRVVFDSKYERLVAQFKAGAQVRVQLRFWPTWPATGTHGATLSLIGFTKAYSELSACR